MPNCFLGVLKWKAGASSYSCMQALIQYTDAATASAAREALDGRSIPRWHSWVSLYCPLLVFVVLAYASYKLNCFVSLQLLASTACNILLLANFFLCTSGFEHQVSVKPQQVKPTICSLWVIYPYFWWGSILMPHALTSYFIIHWFMLFVS